MSENTNIEWCDHTFNPWEGCQKVGPGCDHCYAETRNARFGGGQAPNWGPGAPRRRTSESNWRKPLQWQTKAAEFMAQHGRRQRVFCASLADVFDNAVPVQWRISLMSLILQTPDLDWLLLTKRIGNATEMLDVAFRGALAQREKWADVVPANVWIGATITSQAEADRDIPKLLAVPARVRFLSMEPLLGPVDLAWVDDGAAHRDVPREEWGAADDDDCPPGLWWNVLSGKRTIMHGGATGEWSRRDASVDWVIVGGESGPGARPMHPDWARSLRDQCAAAGVPFLFKQHGEWAPGSGDFGQGRFETAAIDRTGTIVVPGGFTVTDYPKSATSREGWAMVHRPGKKAAGRLLDGVIHNQFPGEIE